MGLADIIRKHGIKLTAGIPYSACKLTRPYIADRFGFEPASVYVGLIPYLTKEYYYAPRKTVSAYASGYDYHRFIDICGNQIVAEAKERFPEASFAVCGDRSPIDERAAAAAAGLGVIGQNGLLITRSYSSYVFIFEIFTDLPADTEPQVPESCIGCGKCRDACPALRENCDCLSSLTQKKGELTAREREIIRSNGYIWGCDVCQEVCPYTELAVKNGTVFTDIPFFLENVNPAPTRTDLDDDAEFQRRAYSWRGKPVVLRNLDVIEESFHSQK